MLEENEISNVKSLDLSKIILETVDKKNLLLLKSKIKIEAIKLRRLVVTSENESMAREDAKNINSKMAEFSALIKAKIAELSVEANAIDKDSKEIIGILKGMRKMILENADQFKKIREKRVEALLEAKVNELYTLFAIEEDFKSVVYDDLIVSSSAYKGEETLQKRVIGVLEARVSKCLKLQAKVMKRLVDLPSICHFNGLDIALQKEDVDKFLMEGNDNIYNSKLQNLIDYQVKRQQEMERVAIQKAAKEQIRNQAIAQEVSKASQPRVVQQEVVEPKIIVPQPIVESDQTNINKKVKYIVTATFEIEMDPKNENRIEAMLVKRFVDAQFKSIPKVEYKREELKAKFGRRVA